MRWKLAEMYRDIEASRCILYRACITANPFPDPVHGRGREDHLQRDVAPRHQRGDPGARRLRLHRRIPGVALYRGARYGTLGGGTTETLRDLIGKRIMDATETGAELLAYDMMSESDLNI